MEDGVWRTIGGRRVYIKKGQSIEDAMKESGKFKKKEATQKETPKVKTDDKKDKYLSRSEMGDLIDKWSSEGFEEGKYKSDYGKGVFHEKYASGQLTGYGGEEDDFVIEGFDLGSAPEKEALEDLNDLLEEYGYKAEYLKEGTVHQDIKISKIKDSLPKETPARTTEQINNEYEELSKKMQADDYYYKPEDDRKLRELRAEYDTEVARGQEDINLTKYKEKEEFKLSEADQEEYDSQRDTDHDGHKGQDWTYGMTPQEWKKAQDEYNAKLDSIDNEFKKAQDKYFESDRTTLDRKNLEEARQKWSEEYNKELARRYPDMMENSSHSDLYDPNVQKAIQEGINESPYRKTGENEIKRLEQIQKEAQAKYDHAQDKYEHYKFDDSEDAKKYRDEYNKAKDELTKANRDYDETRLRKDNDKTWKANGETYTMDHSNVSKYDSTVQKPHKNVYDRSDAEIDDAIQTFNDFKEYEKFGNDEWNYADQTKRDKLAKDSLRNYLTDARLTREEMLDLTDVLENENHNTEARLIEEVYNEINKPKKTMSDTIREKANVKPQYEVKNIIENVAGYGRQVTGHEYRGHKITLENSEYNLKDKNGKTIYTSGILSEVKNKIDGIEDTANKSMSDRIREKAKKTKKK